MTTTSACSATTGAATTSASAPSATGASALYFGGRPRLFTSLGASMWKPVRGYESTYEVSDTGLVRRIPGKGRPKGGALKAIKDRHGYARVKLCVGGKGKDYAVHRLVADAFIGPIPDGLTVNHMDCDTTNNSASNLEICTRHENTLHAVANGRVSLSNATLTADEAAMIRRLATDANMASRALADLFGVTRASVTRIKSGKHWRHLGKE